MNEAQIQDLAALKIIVIALIAEVSGKEANSLEAQAMVHRIKTASLRTADNVTISVDPGQSAEAFRATVKQTIGQYFDGLSFS
ncbi:MULTISPECIES: hypothetical protein [unclassified Mesorhizobium]|uniref:hypothetical protein n=1 Tax=unclassified Mesorhizobium TaxID=325217 RepID=UPI00112ABD9F|nr:MULTISPECIES: hypothetical protein [unclassified Mesorhizobium]MBZ9704593.1 hypothetical protein [Mesorhizobium sp. CO1-1-3]MBZ9950353.1 hypothetical protein [Mesorhizobium sp. BR1-1-11]TPI98023.1 hypothetical protein FJ428_25225 [Mesorhizobium sp. B2-8-1]